MANSLSELQQFFRVDSVSNFFWDKAFANCEKGIRIQVGEIVDSSLQKYHDLDVLKNSNAKIELITKYFPSFLLHLNSEILKNQELEVIARNFYLAGLSAQISKSSLHQLSLGLFVKSCPAESKLMDLNKMLDISEDSSSYFPALVDRDFISLDNNNSTIESSRNLVTLIENSYFFEATSKYYLRYFLELITAAPNDIVAQHIEFIFAKLFISLRLQEMMYWQQFGSGEKLRDQLQYIVHKDKPKQRHPILRKMNFSFLSAFNPIIHKKDDFIRPGDNDPKVMDLLNKLGSLSDIKLTIYLKSILSYKGAKYINFLLDKLDKHDINKLPAYIDYLQNSKAPALNKLIELVITFMSSIKKGSIQTGRSSSQGLPAEKVIMTAASRSKIQAKKNMEANRDVKKMTSGDVAEYLNERLKKRFADARIDGALTQDGIPAYLSKLAKVTQKCVTADSVSEETVQEVAESASTLLQEIAEEGNLSIEKFEDALKDIHETTQKLTTDDNDERLELVEKIGATLADASSENQEEDDNFEEFIQEEIIPIGLEKKAPVVSIEEFFRFPLGEGREITDEDIFNYHIKYLELAENKELIEPSKVEHINKVIYKFEKCKYRKDVNIFPGDNFDNSILMAVYSIWENKALDSLVIKG